MYLAKTKKAESFDSAFLYQKQNAALALKNRELKT